VHHSNYEGELILRNKKLQSICTERNQAITELQNLKQFLRERNVENNKVDTCRMSTEDLMKRSIEKKQPMLLRVSRKSLRPIPRPQRRTPDRSKMGDSLKTAIEDTGFVML
jgi:hypothetical protein